MSLTFVLGSSGAGKSHYLYKEIVKQAEEQPDCLFLVIVPEQFTLQTQRDLVMATTVCKRFQQNTTWYDLQRYILGRKISQPLVLS